MAGLAEGLASVAPSVVSAVGAYLINKFNWKKQEEENEETREREDTAITRAVRDAKNAGLSPLSVFGSSGASSQVMSAPQLSVDALDKGLQSFYQKKSLDSQIEVNDSVVSNNNAQASKANEEANGQTIANANAQAQYDQKLLKLIADTENVHAQNKREAEFLREYRERLTAELESSKASTNAVNVESGIKRSTAEWNESVGLPQGTSHSSNANNLVGASRWYGKNAGEARAQQVEEGKRAYKQEVILWTDEYNRQKRMLKGDPQAATKLNFWISKHPKPKEKDFY